MYDWRELEEARDDMRRELTEIAISAGALRPGDDGGNLAGANGKAERHAYALAAFRHKRGVWRCSAAEMKETLRSILACTSSTL
ncbi:hypothetical protein AS156_09930 [Bradyrhizobium macuxiense]|uniref:Uncharacterized protein n=1 Tax=Bradyrhizobium macuxiense TaxID=1755647 RepID=A0A120FLX2_9BRAD|nr:hypothetical protein [Bradyrhizobium macuxiense]KWV52939.1 hypothetical protein AS156_09930 [Bradyrhizobium macuxiense]